MAPDAPEPGGPTPDPRDPAAGPGDGSVRPRSRLLARARLARAWLAQWLLWDERPTAAAFRLACEERDHFEARVRRLEVELAVAHAEADAAKAEVGILAAVCNRNEERVLAEGAGASADREKALTAAAAVRSARAAGD